MRMYERSENQYSVFNLNRFLRALHFTSPASNAFARAFYSNLAVFFFKNLNRANLNTGPA